MTLTTEDLGDLADVDTAAMDEVLASDAFGKFAILSTSEEAFIQAGNDWQPDDEMGGVLVNDQPVVIHCYTTPAEISDPNRLSRLGSFCRRMAREAHQGEVGLVIDGEYLAFRNFSKE